MKGRWESLLVGGAMLVSGLAHRRAAETGKRVDRLADTVDEAASAVRSSAQAPAVPGMPLPTGYGLQVRGPANESILVPVCLPPGFELDSMMLCPEFFAPSARGGQKEAPPVAGEAPAAAPGSQPVDRIAGTMRYVFGGDQAYSSSVERAEAEPPRPTPQPFTARRDVELHHLA